MDDATAAPAPRSLRVVVADDDVFTTSLVSGGLKAQGFEVVSATSTEDAWNKVSEGDPHVLVSDLNFGPGESGVGLLKRVSEEFPWVGLVVLTSHASPELAVDDASELPAGAVYLVKSHLKGVEDLAVAVRTSISGHGAAAPKRRSKQAVPDDAVTITAAQADVLRLLAEGASTRAVAEHRGTTVRAAETMLARLYVALGAASDDKSNPRVVAVRMWQQGRVIVK